MPQNDLEQSWAGIRAELRRSVTDLAFHLWLEPLEAAAIDRGSLHVRAPRHIRTLVEERYLPLLRAAAERKLGGRVAVKIVGEDWVSPGDPPLQPGLREGRGGGADLLNPKYTFDQFVIADGNRLAHAAALAVAEQPGHAYNPLFLHGMPGLGKTHLLQAIGNYVQRHGRDMSVRYATSDEFTGQFVSAVKRRDGESFKTAFRNVDVLLVDDVQLFGDRLRTQDEFFHTFNALYESGGQLVLSSDRPPVEMATFEQRLVERFGAGLVAELEPPDLHARMAILRKRAMVDRLAEAPDDMLQEVAEHVDTSVRALEGALIRVVAYASLKGEAATPALARRVLERLYPKSEAACTVADVQREVADRFGVSPDLLIAHNRHPRATRARQVAMYLSRELTSASLPTIGAGFGGRNHSTVLHAHKKIAGALEQDRDLAGVVEHVTRVLQSGHHDRAG